jgi:hypothetical protein
LTVSVSGYLPGDPAKTYANRVSIRRVNPMAPSMRIIKAPRNAMAGEQLYFEGFANPSSLNAGRSVQSEWELPDGSTVSGLTLNYTAGASDFSNGAMILRFRAWLQGYRTETEKEIPVSVTFNPYVWPGQFNLNLSQSSGFVPASITLDAKPVSSNVPQYTLDSNLTYTWTLPGVARILSQRNGKVRMTIDQPGSYSFTVDISDELGNNSSLSANASLQPLVPTLDFTASYDKSQHIEPLRVSFWPRVSNLTNDKVAGYSYDEPVTGQSLQGYSGTMTFMAGQYTVTVTATTQNGLILTKTHDISVGESTPPACTIQEYVSPSISTIYLSATCSDPDPNDTVTAYEWRVGNNIISYSYRARYQYQSPGTVDFELIVTDRAGKSSTTQKSVIVN